MHFEEPDLARKFVNQPILADMSTTPDQEILVHCPKTAGAQLTLKYIFEDKFSLYQARILQALSTTTSEVREIALQYIIYRANIKPEAFFDDVYQLLPEDEDTIMQLYQQNQERWKKQGLETIKKPIII